MSRSARPTASSFSSEILRPERILLAIIFALIALGIVIQASIGRATDAGLLTYAGKQAAWFTIGLIAFGVTLRINLELLREFVWPIALLGVVALVSVLLIGHEVNGSSRWIKLPGMTLQTSEFAKLAFLFTLAHYLAKQQRKREQFLSYILLPGLMIGLPVVLLLLQPDYGTAAFFGLVGAALIFLAGARVFFLLPLAGLGISGLFFLVVHSPERMGRLMAFLDVEAHKLDEGYQLHQGLVALGAGGLEGVGLGQGRQQFAFLPEAQTDFIFPIIGEELGLTMTLTVIALYLLFALIGLWQLRKAPNLFQLLLTTGALFFIVGQALINFGVSTGLLPTKGMSLPFVSYGGSNLVALFILFGLIVNCLRRWRQPVELSRGGPA